MTFDYNRYIEELLEQQQQNQGSPYQNVKKITGKVYVLIYKSGVG